MNLLIGLPLKLFSLLFALVRVVLPVLLILLIVWLVRRWKGHPAGQHHAGQTRQEQEPTFKGPVYTVDYEEVEESEDKP